MTASEMVPAVAPRRHCRLCGHGNTGYCDIHQVPPVCICDEPDLRTDCERCGQGYGFGACHRCHMPVGEQFAEVRAAWREHLAKAVA